MLRSPSLNFQRSWTKFAPLYSHFMKIVIRLIQFLVGALFLFSGFIKAVDPLGTSYKMHDYFTAFQTDWPAFKLLWDFMSDYSTQLAVFMPVLELALGLALIIGWKRKFTLWMT